MSTPGWRKSTAITARMADAAHEYGFVQAVRILERSCRKDHQSSRAGISGNPVGGFAPPYSEVVRFAVTQTMAFPGGEVQNLETATGADGNSQWRLLINLIGLTGAMGVLPYHYTEMVLGRQRQKDHNLEEFLNLFNHRIASLFYKAEVKYNLPLQYERSRLFGTPTNQYSAATDALLSLIGMGSKKLHNRLYTSDESLIYYAGLFSQRIRTVGNLRQIIRSHFGIAVQVNQFVGQWCEMIADVRTRLADIDNPKGCNACLGHNAILGKRGWFPQGKIQIVLGPLNRNQLDKFAPGKSGLVALKELVRLYIGIETQFELIVRVYKRDLPDKTTLSKQNPPIMGWNTFLRSVPVTPGGKAETVDIPFSASGQY